MTLFEKVFSPANLPLAWDHVKQNKGAAGIDGCTLDDYPAWAKAHWQNVKRGLERGYYCPQPVKRIEIPKPSGGIRLLGIPTVNDRVIQQAINQVLQPLLIQHSQFIATAFARIFQHIMPLRQCRNLLKKAIVMRLILTWRNSSTTLITTY